METDGDGISTSVGTIRGLPFTSVNARPRIRTAEIMDSIHPSPSLSHDPEHDFEHERDSLASAPDSPASSSSFPSLSSSVFLSSAADGRTGNNSPETHAHDAAAATSGLIIPELTLPPTLRTPTTYGQSLGALRLLVVGRNGVGKSLLANILLDRNEDIVHMGEWVDMEGGGRTLHASTYWIEHKDEHGLEHFEPAGNVEVVEIAGYEDADDPTSTVETALGLVTQPFTTVLELLDPNAASPVLADLISSPSTPLFTALILLLSEAPSPVEQALLIRLSTLIPLIPLPAISHFSSSSTSAFPAYATSRFSPDTALGLRAGLFRTPDTLAFLRSEATSRFLEWREARAPSAITTAQPERARPRRTTISVGSGPRPNNRRLDTRRQSHYARPKLISRPSGTTHPRASSARSPSDSVLPTPGLAPAPAPANAKWDKAAWEASWAWTTSTHPGSPSLSRSPTRRRRQCATRPSGAGSDPLHLPSVLGLAVGLLGPLRDWVGRAFGFGYGYGEAGVGGMAEGDPGGQGGGRGRSRWRVGFALLGAFCVGIGVGLVVKARGTW